MAILMPEKLLVIARKSLKLLLSKARLSATSMSKGWTTMKVIPDVLDEVPPGKLNVMYEAISINEGNTVKPTQVKSIPYVAWKKQEGSMYTLCMVDPDAPSNKKPILREWKHWLVVNIPDTKVNEGEVMAEYIGAGPPQTTGLHRYVFLLYKQPNKLSCDEKKLPKTHEGREKFSARKFAEKYKLGQPVAGNYFLAEFDDYVPVLHKEIGLPKS